MNVSVVNGRIERRDKKDVNGRLQAKAQGSHILRSKPQYHFVIFFLFILLYVHWHFKDGVPAQFCQSQQQPSLGWHSTMTAGSLRRQRLLLGMAHGALASLLPV